MTQEQKAKAYDEALERAKAILKVTDNMRESLLYVSTIFPELRESEDERIRKAILELVRQSSEVLGTQNQNSMIAWLEKQGEQKPNPYSGTSFEYNGHAWGMCARDNGVDILCDKHIIEHFEMQGEQKPADATEKEKQAWYDGYHTSTENWVQRKR